MAILTAVFLFAGIFVHAADDVTGLWIMPDNKANKPPAALVFLYMYDGKLYGRILVLYDSDTGLVEDTISTQIVREANLAGNPPVCGLDFIFEMEDRGREWRGTIVSLPGGKFHNCTIRREGDTLIVRASLRGVLGFIGISLPFTKAAAADLPGGVAVPDANTIVPIIPRR
jgi:hypothetical protein